MFKTLKENIKKAFFLFKSKNVTEIDTSIVLKEIGKALIDSDVNHNIVFNLIKNVKKKSIGKKILDPLNAKQVIIKLVHDELVKLMGGKKTDINMSGNPTIILICGLQGSGKTTFSSKLAFFMKKKGKSPLLVAADIYRPAAIKQLNDISKKVNIPIFYLENNKDVIDIIDKSIIFSSKKKFDPIIIDTAGRLSIDKIMMMELNKISINFNPHETLLVADSMTGQDAINTAKLFSKTLKFDGIVMTKLDGDSKAGSSITISSIINKPIKFISYGEKIQDIEIFYPDRIANRILGMGDVVTFVEKIQEQFNESRAKKIYKKISKNQFNFYDLLDQIKRVEKIGNIKHIISMIPGMDKLSFIDKNKNSFKKIESIIYSMTPYERYNPKILQNENRKKRISNGSGNSLNDINLFIKHFNQMRKIMKHINNNLGRNTIKDLLLEMINKKNKK